ncbi:MAG: DUF2442 domain-containing protein [Gammaproteobacteria bacterium]
MIIKEVFTKEPHRLLVVAEDGRTGEFDLTPYMKSEAFAPLSDPDEFKKVSNGKYYVEWECGADLSADTIEAHLISWTEHPERNAQRGTHLPRI